MFSRRSAQRPVEKHRILAGGTLLDTRGLFRPTRQLPVYRAARETDSSSAPVMWLRVGRRAAWRRLGWAAPIALECEVAPLTSAR